MSVVNRRNAVLGWIVWQVVRRKLRKADARRGALMGLAGVALAGSLAAAAVVARRRAADNGA